MKKKKMNNYEKFTIWMIVVATIVVIGYITFFFIPAEPHFRILKEECKNETIFIGRDLIGYNNTYCNYTIYSPDNMEFPGPYCISEEEYYSKCSRDALKCEYHTDYGFRIILSSEGFIEQKENWREVIKTEQKCETVEVDAIEKWSDPTYGIAPVNCSNLGCEYSGTGTRPQSCLTKQEAIKTLNEDGFFCKDGIVQRLETFPKKYLTKKWLDETCECIKKEYNKKSRVFTLLKPGFSKAWKNVNCKESIEFWENKENGDSQLKSLYDNFCYQPKCSKYKCFDKYHVEAWNQAK